MTTNNQKEKNTLLKYYLNDDKFEVGIDEAGRGPMFGRVYSAAVILPKDDSFNHSLMKDSKKFHSTKKLRETAEYIKSNALYWSVSYEDEKVIDKINIRQANFKSIHSNILNIINKLKIDNVDLKNIFLLVDGNDFKPYTYFDNSTINYIPYECITGGDNLYTSIAAASILAKVARDEYIDDLCERNEYLKTYYDIDKNKGYGTKKHLDGIKEYGITEWHRKTYGICKTMHMSNFK